MRKVSSRTSPFAFTLTTMRSRTSPGDSSTTSACGNSAASVITLTLPVPSSCRRSSTVKDDEGGIARAMLLKAKTGGLRSSNPQAVSSGAATAAPAAVSKVRRLDMLRPPPR